ncbi:MAG: NAD(P)/FAD-dependent oxidoreductase [Acidimicrobiales bacterium]
MSSCADVVIVGAGHNGLVAACYLAEAGRQVTVLEGLDRPGGGSRTEATIAGLTHRFDLHSVAHNIINLTSIPEELDLAGAGLDYQEMDPFSVAIHADGRRVRFWRSVEATVDSIAQIDAAEAQAYQRFIEGARPLISAVLPAIRGEQPITGLPRRAADVIGFLRGNPLERIRDLLGPYDALLHRSLRSDLTRGPVAAIAAHAGVGPTVPGGALFAHWQAVYHRHGQWHARGGAQGLTDALMTRARALGVDVRCSMPVTRIDTSGGRVRAVVIGAGNERIGTRSVITAIDPKLALLDICDPPLGGPAGADLAAARRGNVVQALIHIATDRLPTYSDSIPADHHGLQSYVDRLDDLSRAWLQAEAGRLPDPLPLYTFTPSAIDPSVAPEGQHTVYLACPAAPAQVEGGWEARADEFVERALSEVDRRAPGFRSTITGVAVRHPDLMEAETGWPGGGHPMHLDITLDQLGPLRPTRRLGGHRTPIDGLYISGAGTSPTGGIAGTPGKLAARALLHDAAKRRRRR